MLNKMCKWQLMATKFFKKRDRAIEDLQDCRSSIAASASPSCAIALHKL